MTNHERHDHLKLQVPKPPLAKRASTSDPSLPVFNAKPQALLRMMVIELSQQQRSKEMILKFQPNEPLENRGEPGNPLVSYSPILRLKDTHLITNNPGYSRCAMRRAQIEGLLRFPPLHNIAAGELFSVVQSYRTKRGYPPHYERSQLYLKEIAPSRESKNFKKIPREVIVSYRTHRYY
jgi:hypothetical protein